MFETFYHHVENMNTTLKDQINASFVFLREEKNAIRIHLACIFLLELPWLATTCDNKAMQFGVTYAMEF